MIIVEGPDGAGKTTLIRELKHWLELPVAPRVVQKDTTTTIDMKQWVEDNLLEGAQPMIYDRHRLISETIYGPVKRNVIQPGFDDVNWLGRQMDNLYNEVMPFIIYCLPPLAVVRANVEFDDDNVAVKNEIGQIYSGYVARASIDSAALSTSVKVWDYTNPDHKSESGRPYFLPSLRRYTKSLKEHA